MTLANDELLAPWSVSLAHGAAFTISGSTNSTLVSPTPARPCSSATAIGFIEKFCRLHSIHDQSLAALAAVLLLPSLKGLKSSSLPALRIKGSKPNLSMVAQEQQQRRREKQFIELPRVPQKQDLDLLLTASCYCTGIDTILFSVFFEPGVECNKAGPWLQGALDVANDLLESDPWGIGADADGQTSTSCTSLARGYHPWTAQQIHETGGLWTASGEPKFCRMDRYHSVVHSTACFNQSKRDWADLSCR